jgi:hypothetical protein
MDNHARDPRSVRPLWHGCRLTPAKAAGVGEVRDRHPAGCGGRADTGRRRVASGWAGTPWWPSARRCGLPSGAVAEAEGAAQRGCGIRWPGRLASRGPGAAAGWWPYPVALRNRDCPKPRHAHRGWPGQVAGAAGPARARAGRTAGTGGCRGQETRAPVGHAGNGYTEPSTHDKPRRDTAEVGRPTLSGRAIAPTEKAARELPQVGPPTAARRAAALRAASAWSLRC